MLKNRSIIIVALMYVFLVIGTFVLPREAIIVLALLFEALVAIIFARSVRRKDRNVLSFLVSLPIFMSCFQNMYLGMAADNLDQLSLQILLTMNIFIIWICLIFALFNRLFKKEHYLYIALCVAIIIYALVFYLINPAPVSAFIASFRNIIAPVSILLFSLVTIKYCNKELLFKYLFAYIWLVVIIGVIELIVGNNFWINLNISKLWGLKGLDIGFREVPGNFYSSEYINGFQIRRMVSSFADPVNLGTFLFAAFMVCWYKRKRILTILTIACCFLTVSKGALLGFLVFLALYAIIMMKKNKKNIVLRFVGVVLAIVLAVIFYQYSQVNSSGSLNAHINGFLTSLEVLSQHPLGTGLGNVGVLASKLGSELALETGIFETGFGMIVGQLGLLGLIVYAAFLIDLFKKPIIWKDGRDKFAWYVLLISFVLNMVFNEVALSPNSCALYFIMLGYLYNKDKDKE